MPNLSLPVVILIGWAAAADAQQFVSTGRDALRGLTGVEVIVEGLPPDIERAGLSSETIRTAVERQLRDGHVTVYASQRSNPSPAQPYVYVQANAVSFDQGNRYAIAIQVQVRQRLQSLVTGSRIVDAMTWDSHDVLVVPASRVAELGAEIHSHVDRFVGDWAAVH